MKQQPSYLTTPYLASDPEATRMLEEYNAGLQEILNDLYDNINNPEVIDYAPTADAPEGTIKFELSGSTLRFYQRLNNAWNYVPYSSNTGQTIIDIGSGNNLISGNDVDGFWVGHATFGSAPFRVTIAGAVTATSLTITGGATGGWDIVSGYLYSLQSGTPTSSPTDGIVMASGNEAIIAYEDTAKRVELGYLSSGVYGFKAYATNGTTVIFEASDTQQKMAGWYFDDTTLATNATVANANVLIDSANSLLRLGPTSGNYITIDGANQKVESSNYVSGYAGAGFHLSSGLLEIGNIACRGIFRTAVFQKDIISAVGGNVIISKGADLLNADMTALDASTLTIEGNETFAVSDILRIKDGADDEWMTVTNIASAPTYTVTRDGGSAYGADANPTWKTGATVVNYGPSAAGGVYMTASETNAPYVQVFTHAGAPWTTISTHMRMGNLNGYLGYAAATYGIGIGGSAANNANLTFDTTNGLRLRTATTDKIVLDMSGNAYIAGTVTIGGSSGVLASSVDGWKHTTDTTLIDGGDIYANSVVVAKLNSDATNRMFDDSTKATNIQAWIHASDATLIDGGDIYANTIVLAGLASETTDRMFDASTTSDNIQAWVHATDVTKIDGGDIYTNTIVVAGLASTVTDRMFLDGTTKTNIEAWRHATDVTLIDGGDIYTNTIVVAGLASAVTDRMWTDSTTKTNIEAWKHATDVTLIDGGDIYAGSITLASSAGDFDMDTITDGSTYKKLTANQETGADRAYADIDSSGNYIGAIDPAHTAPSATGAGLYLGSDYLGYYSGSAWTTYMDSSANFYLGGTSGKLQWNGTTLVVSAKTATSGARVELLPDSSTGLSVFDGTGADVLKVNVGGTDIGDVIIGNKPSGVLLLHLDGTDGATSTTDSSDSGHAITFVGTAQLDTTAKKWGTASLELDGDSDSITALDSADWDIVGSLTDSWTIDFWVKHDDHVGSECYMAQRADGDNYWFIRHNHGDGLDFVVNKTTYIAQTTRAGEITDTNWHHIAVCKIAAKIGIYKDGDQVGYSALSDVTTLAAILQIGVQGTAWYMDGHIDEVRITKGNPFGAVPQTDFSDTITTPTAAYADKYAQWDKSAGVFKVANLQSPDYVADTTGYKLSASDGLEINTGTIEGTDFLAKIMIFSMLFGKGA